MQVSNIFTYFGVDFKFKTVPYTIRVKSHFLKLPFPRCHGSHSYLLEVKLRKSKTAS